jgi:hypothetical protein
MISCLKNHDECPKIIQFSKLHFRAEESHKISSFHSLLEIPNSTIKIYILKNQDEQE